MSEENYNENVSETVEATVETSNQAPQSKGMAIAAMVLGIVSIVLCCIWYISVPCAIIGLILGILYNKKGEKSGMATAGIVCSIIGIVLVLAVVILAVIGVAALGAAGLSGMY